MSSRALVAALLAVGLAACATQEDPGRSAPRDPGATTQWQNLGVTPMAISCTSWTSDPLCAMAAW
ncbi:MAG: hypothetical protein U1E47_09315 [Rivihabitans pingtungensis]